VGYETRISHSLKVKVDFQRNKPRTVQLRQHGAEVPSCAFEEKYPVPKEAEESLALINFTAPVINSPLNAHQ
jgi:hypothetical protein